ncbi:MAG TPA: tRNA (adenosine(37)-N6)-threonylcarbamoyltransferase complex ATPase subunit type 1 TsaE [Actinomycetota bacterium]
MGSEIRLRTRSADESREVGAAIARALIPGDVVSLTGDLGAGKTTLVQGAARELGVTDPVASPTFVLVREYRGPLPIYHVDVYRLERIQEVLDLGFEDLLDPHGVVFIEWGDAIEGLLPDSHLEVELHALEGDDEREVVVRARGPRWTVRWIDLSGSLGSWRAA